MVGRILHRVRRKFRVLSEPAPHTVFPLHRNLSLPTNVTESALRAFLAGVRPAGSPEDEMTRYFQEDFQRFLLTWQLTEGRAGNWLELGALPYFSALLLRRFSRLELTLANYFGSHISTGPLDQEVICPNYETGKADLVVLPTHHFNIERDVFPFA